MNSIREVLLARTMDHMQLPECLEDGALVALADGTASTTSRAEWMPHLSSCRRCQRELASLCRALVDPEVVRSVRAADRRALPWRAVGLSLSAAAALLLVVVSRPDERLAPSAHRAPALTPTSAPVATAPVGPVDRPAIMAWSEVQGADRYRLTVYTADGKVVYETETDDTTAMLPDSLALAAGARYLWQVQARTDFDRWVTSDLVEFRIATSHR